MQLISSSLAEETIRKAKESARKRMNYNFHVDFSDPINRMLNAMEPGTYVQPHKYENPDKREVFLVLEGTAAVVCFDATGEITEYTLLNRNKKVYGVEIPPKTWHTVISLESGTILYEIKDGPYSPLDDKNFALWAPREGEARCDDYLTGLIKKLNLEIFFKAIS